MLSTEDSRPGKNTRVPIWWCTDPGKNSLIGIPEYNTKIRALHFDTILRPINHDTLCDGIEYNKFFWTKSTNQLKLPQKSLFHFIKRHLSDLSHDRLHAYTEWWHVRAAQSTLCNLKKWKGDFNPKWKFKFKMIFDCTHDAGYRPWITYPTRVH